jgi:hypothetical protein
MRETSLWCRTRLSAKARRLHMLLGVAAGFVAAGCSSSAIADASPPILSVSDMGQPSAPVIVGQPALTVASSGTCEAPFTIESASTCPTGTWPALGGSWGPIENAAGGDTLQLTFTATVTKVTVASTSNYTPGLTNPSGEPVPNYDVLGATSASGGQTTWMVTLPQWDARAISGYTFSVVAQDAEGSHDYALMLRSPRFANEATHCSESYYSTGLSQYSCTTSTVPPGGGLRGAGEEPRETSSGGQRGGSSGRDSETGAKPPLRVVRTWRTHGRLHIKATVPGAGTLDVIVEMHGRRKRTIKLHPTAAGTVLCSTTMGTGQVRVRLILRGSTGAVKRTQAVTAK